MADTVGTTIAYYQSRLEDYKGLINEGTIKSLQEKELEKIDYINQKIASMENLKNTIDFLFHETQSLLPCDRIAVSFFEEDGRRLRLSYVQARYTPLLINQGYSADIKESSLRKVFEQKTPRIINNLEEYAGIKPPGESTILLLKEGVKSNMTCPLIVEGRPVGLLFRSSKKINAYSERDILIHLLISERLSQAVEKEYRIEQLSEAINAYMEMLGFVTHELKSPLDSIITMGKTLTAGIMGGMDPRHRDYTERIIKKAEYLSNLAADYLNLSRFEGDTARYDPSEVEFISEIIEEAVEMTGPQINEKKMTLEKKYSQENITIHCDKNLMKIVMVNLLSNAAKYGNDNGKITVTCGIVDDKLTVSVWNQGPGFSDEDRSRLFRKFSRLQSDELLKRKGSGIGLYISWKILQLHEGAIRARSELGSWAEFSFEVPV